MSTVQLFRIGTRAALFASLAAASVPALASPLTIRVGESWVFALDRGEPVRARRVAAGAKPAPGQIKASVSAMAGTTMTLTNNSDSSYTFDAQLVGAPPARANKRSCTLPPRRLTIEYWPVTSAGVRIGRFKMTNEAAACPG